VFYYFKDAIGPEANIVYTWGPENNHFVSVAGHTSETLDVQTNDPFLTKDKMVLKTYWNGSGRFFDPNSWSYNPTAIIHEDLKPKTHFMIRYVVIPGGMKGGRMANYKGVNFKDYKSVAKYFNIKD
jgi:hypothetical protein